MPHPTLHLIVSDPRIGSLRSLVAAAKKRDVEIVYHTPIDPFRIALPTDIAGAMYRTAPSRAARIYEQMLFEAGVRSIRNNLASFAYGNDKFHQLTRCIAAGIPVAPTWAAVDAPSRAALDTIVDAIGLPVVLKQSSGAKGDGISIARSMDELVEKTAQMSAIQQSVVYQKYIPAGAGQTVRAIVLGGRVIASLIYGSTTDFRANVGMTDATCAPYALSKESADIAVRATEAIGSSFGGVDLFIDGNECFVSEVNLAPNFARAERICGVAVGEMLLEYLLRDA